MLAAWNELDAARVRGHLELALAADAVFVDPTIVTRGIAEFEANVHDFGKRYPAAQCRRTSAFDTHHGLFRYQRDIRIGEQTLLEGRDVVEVDGEGKVWKVQRFFGPLRPAGDAPARDAARHRGDHGRGPGA